MRKYILLTAILALCACNNGGGGHGNINTKPGSVSGGNQGTNTPTPDNPKPIMELKSNKIYLYSTMGNFAQWDVGTLDRNTNKIYINKMVSENGYYDKLCTQDEGCDVEYKYGEYYYSTNSIEPETSGNDDEQQPAPTEPEITYELTQCKDSNGCSFHIDKDIWLIEYCHDKNGCVWGSGEFNLAEMQNDKGIYLLEEEIEPDTKNIITIASGAENQNVPLQFSDFGYWKFVGSDFGRDMTTIESLIAGDPAKEVDMKALAEIKEIEGLHTYTGKAFVEISSGFIDYANEPLTDAHKDKDTANGFSASGEAKLTFDANNGIPKERLLMNFTDAGWYNVYMNGDGSDLKFFGNTKTDERFKFAEAPTKATDAEIKYYGNNTVEAASEVVGTVSLQSEKMQDGLNRGVFFSFGAVKD